jgi:hypothetical protein
MLGCGLQPAPIDAYHIPSLVARENLARLGSFLFRFLQHLLPLRQPSHCLGNAKQHREHIRFKPNRLVNDARVRTDDRVQLAFNEAFVFQRALFELQGGVDSVVPSRDLKDLIGRSLNDPSTGAVILADPMAEPQQPYLPGLHAVNLWRDVLLTANLVEHLQHLTDATWETARRVNVPVPGPALSIRFLE